MKRILLTLILCGLSFSQAFAISNYAKVKTQPQATTKQTEEASLPDEFPEQGQTPRVVDAKTGPYVHGALGAAIFQETNRHNQKRTRVNLAIRAGYGYSRDVKNNPAPLFIGAELNVISYGNFHDGPSQNVTYAFATDAEAIFGLHFNKLRVYLKGGPAYVSALNREVRPILGGGTSYPLANKFRVFLEGEYIDGGMPNGITDVVSGLQYYF